MYFVFDIRFLQVLDSIIKMSTAFKTYEKNPQGINTRNHGI